MDSTVLIERVVRGEIIDLEVAKRAICADGDLNRQSDLSRVLEAMRQACERSDERRDYYAELAIWSARRLGELIQEGQQAGIIATRENGRPKAGGKCCTLQHIGIERTYAHRCQKLAELDRESIEAFIQTMREAGKEITKAGALRLNSEAPASAGEPGLSDLLDALERAVAAVERKCPDELLSELGCRLKEWGVDMIKRGRVFL